MTHELWFVTLALLLAVFLLGEQLAAARLPVSEQSQATRPGCLQGNDSGFARGRLLSVIPAGSATPVTVISQPGQSAGNSDVV